MSHRDKGNVSYLGVGTVPVQSDGLNSALSPVVYGDIAWSIKINKHKKLLVIKLSVKVSDWAETFGQITV